MPCWKSFWQRNNYLWSAWLAPQQKSSPKKWINKIWPPPIAPLSKTQSCSFFQSRFSLSIHFCPCPFLCSSFTRCSPWPEPGREPWGRWMKWLSWAGLPLSQGSPQGVSSRKGHQQLWLPPAYTSHPIIQLVLSCMGCMYIKIRRDSSGGRKEEVKMFRSEGI